MLECRLCNSNDVFVKYKFNSCRVGCCRKCGFIQVLEKPNREDLFKIYNPEYFKRGKYVNDRAINLENKRRILWLKQNGVEKGARVLDVGCATGDFIKAARSQFDMWGLDISKFAVEKARFLNPDISQQIRVGQVEEQSFTADFFDVIVLWDVIEHLWDPVGAIHKLVKILKPGGRLVISTPNIGAFTARIFGKYWAFMTVPEHLSFFNQATINHLFKKTGLTPLNWSTKGKWVNFGFLLYKIQRIFPKLFPNSLLQRIKKTKTKNFILYIPTNDIQYTIAIRSK